MTRRSSLVSSLSGTALSALIAFAAAAQVAKPTEPPAKPAESAPPAAAPATPPKPETAPPKSSSKSLDELLGIPKSSGASDAAGEKKDVPSDADIATDKAHERVEQALDEKAIENLLRQALGNMRVSADRLAKETDSGLGTQRVQQEAIAKLDALIEEAKKRCNKQSKSQCSSSGSCDKPGEKSGEKQAQKPGDSKSKSMKPSDKTGATPGANAGGGEPPQVAAVDQGKLLDETQAEWGNLPERIRELIRQGSRDRIAAIYQRLTEEYYRRMAEDASK